jgi:predicted signal transduction protein with EAL and GGDEF domain
MALSESAHRLKDMINKAIEDHKLTRDEYDMIIHMATEDGHVDPQERALLAELQDMIENRMVRLVAK